MNTIETLRFVKEHVHDDVHALALQSDKYPDVDMPTVLTQIEGRQTAKIKLPSWYQTDGILYPPHLSMEQCSSEQTARYKASLLKGNTLVDLTGGFGVDFSFMARRFRQATYVERQTHLVELAEHNFKKLGLTDKITAVASDGVDYLYQMPPVDVLYLDPSRRDRRGGKVVAMNDCEPNISTLEPLLTKKAKTTLVKLSPMFDISLAMKALKHISAIHIVAVNNECKELLLVLEKGVRFAYAQIPIRCVNLTKEGIQSLAFTEQEEQAANCPYARAMSRYLYEPNAALMKGGAYKLLAQRYAVRKLHANSHLYTSSAHVPDFPGRKFEVEAVSDFGKKALKHFLKDTDRANVTIRNFPTSVVDLRRKLKLKEGGDIYLFATTLSTEEKVLIKAIPVADGRS